MENEYIVSLSSWREKPPHIVMVLVLLKQRKQLKRKGENMKEFMIIE